MVLDQGLVDLLGVVCRLILTYDGPSAVRLDNLVKQSISEGLLQVEHNLVFFGFRHVSRIHDLLKVLSTSLVDDSTMPLIVKTFILEDRKERRVAYSTTLEVFGWRHGDARSETRVWSRMSSLYKIGASKDTVWHHAKLDELFLGQGCPISVQDWVSLVNTRAVEVQKRGQQVLVSTEEIDLDSTVRFRKGEVLDLPSSDGNEIINGGYVASNEGGLEGGTVTAIEHNIQHMVESCDSSSTRKNHLEGLKVENLRDLRLLI